MNNKNMFNPQNEIRQLRNKLRRLKPFTLCVPDQVVKVRRYRNHSKKQGSAFEPFNSEKFVEVTNQGGGVFIGVCSCGDSRYYSAHDLSDRLAMDAGCCSIGCDKDLLKTKILASPETAVEVQLKLLFIVAPEQLQSSWGGKADDLNSVLIEEGIANFRRQFEVDITSRNPWLGKRDDSLPFIDGNIVMQDYPHNLFTAIDRKEFDLDGWTMTLSEIARLSNAGINEIIEVVVKSCMGTVDLNLFIGDT